MSSLRKELEKREFETLDLFTVSFSLFKSNFTNFVIIGFLCGLPLMLSAVYFPLPVLDSSKLRTYEDVINWFRNEVSTNFYINIFLNSTLDIISVISISLLVESLIYNKIKTATWAVLKSFKLLMPALITYLIYSIIIFFGFVLFIVPGIVFIVFFVFSTNICALRHTWGINALKYSMSLSKNKFFKTLFIISFIFLFETVLVQSFPSAPLNTREGLLYYFISMAFFYFFDTYFKVILALFFLNRDFFLNAQIDIEEDDEDYEYHEYEEIEYKKEEIEGMEEKEEKENTIENTENENIKKHNDLNNNNNNNNTEDHDNDEDNDKDNKDNKKYK